MYIVNAENKFAICPESSLVLGVNNTFSSYLWSTGAVTPTITVTNEGTYTVVVKAANGCELTDSQDVTGLPGPDVEATATPEQINEGESSQLTASGLLDYTWQPGESLSPNASIAEPLATPFVSTTYTVTGKDANGCVGTATVEVRVQGESIVSKLGPSNFFSPNGDPVGQFWLVDKIDEYPQCGVTIYDDKGVKVYEAKPYQNTWDGVSTNGKKMPDGVYYYIIRCDGEESAPRTGSITILR
jgi:gliding motility-associated-like protein